MSNLKKNIDMKKTVFFVALMLLSAFAPIVRATGYWGTVVAPTGQTLYWKLNTAEQNIIIVCPGFSYSPWSGYNTNFSKPIGNLVIPATVAYNGTSYPVSYIDKYTFSTCDSLTSVVIPSTVKWIEDSAFLGCTRLTTVAFPDSLRAIGRHAFGDCTNLAAVTIPDRTLYIGEKAFFGCTGLATLTLGDMLYQIRDSAFFSCSSLATVTIPEAITYLGKSAFQQCNGLTSIYFNAMNCTYAGGTGNERAFGNCMSVDSVIVGNRVKQIPDFLCYRMNNDWTTLILGDSITHIGREAFLANHLTTITIPASVTHIGPSAFRTSLYLDTVYMMPPTPPELGDGFTFATSAQRTRVFVLSGCAYDNYYTEDSNSPWYSYRFVLRDPEYDFNVIVSSANPEHGTAGVIPGRSDRDVRCDSTAVIEAVANTGYRFSHWSNGSTNNPDTLMLTSDTTVEAYFELGDPVAIQPVADGSTVDIHVENGCITVTGVDGEPVQIFDIMGRQIQTFKQSGNQAIPAGIYMVKVGARPAQKIVVIRN